MPGRQPGDAFMHMRLHEVAHLRHGPTVRHLDMKRQGIRSTTGFMAFSALSVVARRSGSGLLSQSENPIYESADQ